MTCSLKPAFSIHSGNDFNHKKKTCFRTRSDFRKKEKKEFFYHYRKQNGGKIIQSFVVRNSNLVLKMCQRRFLWYSPHYSNQTLVLPYKLQHVKGT